jgi:hypothetical protein
VQFYRRAGQDKHILDWYEYMNALHERLAIFVLIFYSVTLFAYPQDRCDSETRSRAESLLALHSDSKDDLTIESKVKHLKPVKDPIGKSKLKVDEVWGHIDKVKYRMRFFYQVVGDQCVLAGQEILEF